ncbi:hypothetical protein [Nocardia salmonicida]|uniref:hypothetical protein n=1 Tax=Nocardia salmonicida TaxID=53431 RepID=UPI00365081CA
MTAPPLSCGYEPWHGTVYGYTRKGCRRDDCTAAATSAAKDVRKRRLAMRIVRDGRPYAERDSRGHLLPHGDASTYQNWACRCLPCTAANTSKGTTP